MVLKNEKLSYAQGVLFKSTAWSHPYSDVIIFGSFPFVPPPPQYVMLPQ